MKIVCVGDAFITPDMMREGVAPFLKAEDSLEVLFWGQEDREAMREVTTSILLYGPYTRTLGVQIYSLRDACRPAHSPSVPCDRKPAGQCSQAQGGPLLPRGNGEPRCGGRH